MYPQVFVVFSHPLVPCRYIEHRSKTAQVCFYLAIDVYAGPVCMQDLFVDKEASLVCSC